MFFIQICVQIEDLESNRLQPNHPSNVVLEIELSHFRVEYKPELGSVQVQ